MTVKPQRRNQGDVSSRTEARGSYRYRSSAQRQADAVSRDTSSHQRCPVRDWTRGAAGSAVCSEGDKHREGQRMSKWEPGLCVECLEDLTDQHVCYWQASRVCPKCYTRLDYQDRYGTQSKPVDAVLRAALLSFFVLVGLALIAAAVQSFFSPS
jgi:hypothetical protein